MRTEGGGGGAWREECGLGRAGPALLYDILCYSSMKPYQLARYLNPDLREETPTKNNKMSQ